MFIFGNASNLRQNETWATILDEMEARGQVGPGLPVICPRHKEEAHLVSRPGSLEEIAPAGGCRAMCKAVMPCGHVCPSFVSGIIWHHELRIHPGIFHSATILGIITQASDASNLARGWHAGATVATGARGSAGNHAGLASSLTLVYSFPAGIQKLVSPGTSLS